MSFADRLNEMLDVKNISAAELSRITGIDEGTISNYRKGKYIPKQIKLDKITRALNTSVAYMLGQTSEESPTHFSQPENYVALTPHENDVISAYREKTEMQSAVDTLLGVSTENTYKIKIAARGGGVTEEELTESKIEALKNLPDADEF